MNEILQTGSVILLLVTCLLLILHSEQVKHLWVGVGFGLSIVCFLVVESEAVHQSRLLWVIVVTVAVTNPVFFWLLAKAIFDDHFKPSAAIVVWFALVVTTHASLYFRNSLISTKLADVLVIVGQLTSIGFVLSAIYTAVKTKRDDLIDSRLRFRNIFIVVTAIISIVALVAEAIPLSQQIETFIKISQRVCILAMTTYFLANNFSIKPGFFFKTRENAKTKSTSGDDPQLKASLLSFLNDQKIYRKEGLTIRQLADLMNVQEYRLRRLINGQLAFKNFNDFLNQYRIHEAREILADDAQSQKTVQEISYQLGYKSIGPFNKAFKEMNGLTPTAFRKSHVR